MKGKIIKIALLITYILPTIAYSIPKNDSSLLLGESFKNKYTYQRFLCKTEEYYFFYKYPSDLVSSGTLKEFEILIFDKKLNLVETRRIKPNYKDKSLTPNEAKFIDGKIVLFSTRKIPKADEMELYVQTYNPENLRLNSDARLIYKAKGQAFNHRWKSNFKFVKNNSKKGILALYLKKPNNKEGKPSYSAFMLSNQLQVLWTKNIEFNMPLKEIYLEKIISVNSSKIFFLIRHMKANQHRIGTPTSKFYIYSIENGENIYHKPVLLEKGSRHVTDCQIGVNNNGELICAGLFSDIDYIIKGNFEITFHDVKSMNGVAKYNLFDDGFINQFITSDLTHKDNLVFKSSRVYYTNRIYDILFNNDGSYEFVFEQFQNSFVMQRYNENFFNMSSIIVHGNIYVLFIDKSGKMTSAFSIPKLQITNTIIYKFVYNSFAFSKSNNRLHFYFNDNIDNVKGDNIKPKDAFKGNNTCLVEVIVDKDGIKSKRIIGTNINNMKLLPNNCIQTSDTEMILSMTKGTLYKNSLGLLFL